MAIVGDTFQRANGTLQSSSWLVPAFPFSEAGVGSIGGGIQIKNNAFAPLDSGGDAALSVWQGQTFGNDQWAAASIASIAPFTSQVHITACSSSAGTSTYTYTLTSGAALQTLQQIIISGMTNSGNNVNKQITGLGAGTFSVANASPGANESGSNGTGKSPSDSNCGVAVRCSSNGKNGYFLSIGTNSCVVGTNGTFSPVDSRVYDVELWKVVNGTATFLANTSVISSITDVVGGIYALSVKGTTLTVCYNSSVLFTKTDTDLSSGSPGIFTWSVGGGRGMGESYCLYSRQ